MPLKIDQIDKNILRHLQQDSKINIKELASDIGLTKTPVYDRIKRMEQSGVIDRYVAVLSKKILSKSMVIFCTVSLETQKIAQINAFNDAVMQIPEVVECYLMGGANDYLLKVVVKDLQTYHEFSSGKLAALPNVAQIKSTFILDEVKHSTVYPILL